MFLVRSESRLESMDHRQFDPAATTLVFLSWPAAVGGESGVSRPRAVVQDGKVPARRHSFADRQARTMITAVA